MRNRSLFTGCNPPHPTFLRPILKSTAMGWGWIALKVKEGSPSLDWWEANMALLGNVSSFLATHLSLRCHIRGHFSNVLLIQIKARLAPPVHLGGREEAPNR